MDRPLSHANRKVMAFLLPSIAALLLFSAGCSSGGNESRVHPEGEGGSDPGMGPVTHASSTSSASSSSSTAGSGGSCSAPGQACGSGCCQSGPTVGPFGAVCVSEDNECHAICHSNDECSSGCCAGLEGKSYGACATADHCCAAPGEACGATKCCQSGPDVGSNGAVCVSNDNECHAICYSNSDCNSGCCAMLSGQNYGACAAASYCGGGSATVGSGGG
jgi:hypothetical protein